MGEMKPYFNKAEWYQQRYTGRISKWHWFPTQHEGDGVSTPVCGANIIAERAYGDSGIVWIEDVCRRCMKILEEATDA